MNPIYLADGLFQNFSHYNFTIFFACCIPFSFAKKCISFHLPEINQIIFISIYKHQMKGLGLSFIYKLLAVVAPQSIHEDRYRKYNQNNRIRFGCHNYICLDELDQEFIPLGSTYTASRFLLLRCCLSCFVLSKHFYNAL